MGLPEILISFLQKATTAVQKSSRGMVAVLLEDSTTEQFLSPYRKEKELKKEDWTEGNLKMLKLAFKGAPQKVLAIRMLKTDGAADLEGTLKEILPINIDYLVYPGYKSGQMAAFKTFLKDAHAKGKKVKAVLPSCDADCEHIINFATPSITAKWEDQEEAEEYTCAQYTCRIAGILAGLPLTQSSTYYALEEVVDAQGLEEDVDAAIDAGKLILVFDGEKYKIGRGVTSLVKISSEKTEDLKKIKIVEGMDVLIHDIYSTFEENYVGKLVNSYDNKQMFVGAVNDYFSRLYGSVLDGNADNYVEVSAELNREYLEEHNVDTADMTEQKLKEANTGSWMFLEGTVKFLDAAEDLKLQMTM